MTEGNQKKMVAILGMSNLLIQYIEDVREEHPQLVRLSFKKALNDTISEAEKLHGVIFVGLEGRERMDVADQINNITLKTEEFVNNDFNFN